MATGTATTSNLAITGIVSNLLKANTIGQVTAAALSALCVRN
jgi:hypothetical protein